jgi:hypothetical protein
MEIRNNSLATADRIPTDKVSDVSTLRTFVRKIILSTRLANVLVRYRFGIEPTHRDWLRMLRLHCLTNGISTRLARRAMAVLRPAPPVPKAFQSLFGDFDTKTVSDAAQVIRDQGFYVFPKLIPADICDEIANGVRDYSGWSWRDSEGLHQLAKFDPQNLTAPRYELPEAEIWKITAYQRIVADPLFTYISRAYFGGAAMLKEIGLWWSPGLGSDRADSIGAQMFHFDYDAAPVWLKFFVYVNDVGAQNGPHVFVRGSHRPGNAKGRDIIARGYERVTDEEIEKIYGRDNVLEMTGPKGTVFAVDTMGFHKGKLPVSGHRLLAQLEFASPLFVQAKSHPLPMPANAVPGLLAARAAHPDAFARFPA